MQIFVVEALPARVLRAHGTPQLGRLFHQHPVLGRFRNNVVELSIKLFELVAVAINHLFLLRDDLLQLTQLIEPDLRGGKPGDIAFDHLTGPSNSKGPISE